MKGTECWFSLFILIYILSVIQFGVTTIHCAVSLFLYLCVYVHLDRHHLHIVSVNVNEADRRLNKNFIHRRSKDITTEWERKYGLYLADKKTASP